MTLGSVTLIFPSNDYVGNTLWRILGSPTSSDMPNPAILSSLFIRLLRPFVSYDRRKVCKKDPVRSLCTYRNFRVSSLVFVSTDPCHRQYEH